VNTPSPPGSSLLVASTSVAIAPTAGAMLVVGAVAGTGMLVAAAGVGGLAFGEKKTWPLVLTGLGVAVALAATLLGETLLAAAASSPSTGS
jgi:hypothetical protein